MKIDRFISYIILAIIIIASIGVIFIVVNPAPGEKFTEFYILGSDGKAGNYPTNLTVNESGTLIIGIVNHEGAPTNYQLAVKLNNNTITQQNISLQNNEKKETTFTFTPNQTGNNQTLDFYLFKLPDTQNVYRFLELLINVS
ncbi:MAG TPA: DUF1616 domain-containing protein [Methanobacterium sp.]|nr:DUF1616 domain-containing protein [Methanobacterium sp.]